MADIVGVVLMKDIKNFEISGILSGPPVTLGPRATRAAIHPLLQAENVRIFIVPLPKGERINALKEVFGRHEMVFDEQLVEEWWNIPNKNHRILECRRVIAVGMEISSVYYTKAPDTRSEPV